MHTHTNIYIHTYTYFPNKKVKEISGSGKEKIL